MYDNNLISSWKTWSDLTKKDPSYEYYDGWESDFPEWGRLIEYMCKQMLDRHVTQQSLKDIEFTWGISEETEDMLEFSKENLEFVYHTIFFLSGSNDPRVRWQIYTLAGLYNTIEVRLLLRRAICDEDNYCRRIALLSISKIKLPDTENIVLELIKDADPYIKMISIEFFKNIDNEKLINELCAILAVDESEFVRNRVKKYIESL